MGTEHAGSSVLNRQCLNLHCQGCLVMVGQPALMVLAKEPQPAQRSSVCTRRKSSNSTSSTNLLFRSICLQVTISFHSDGTVSKHLKSGHNVLTSPSPRASLSKSCEEPV